MISFFFGEKQQGCGRIGWEGEPGSGKARCTLSKEEDERCVSDETA
jgi:hypothetical protein